MISPLTEGGLLVTDIPALPRSSLEDALASFCGLPAATRQSFSQSRYGVAFDGYSWPGQLDSLNQGPEDQLHSFVLSDFQAPASYPQQFQPFLTDHWQSVTGTVRQLEEQLLVSLGLRDVLEQYRSGFGHMLSANYYPPLAASEAGPQTLRLTEHPDVSLLTVFAFGMDSDFQYQDHSGQWQAAPASDRVVVFAGELLQWLTGGSIAALNHRVKRKPGDRAARFSFALFSLPRPGFTLRNANGETLTGDAWYRLHLSQWD